jgi:hypothetical protein
MIMHAISTLAAAGAFGLVLLAVPSYARTVPAVEDDSIRPFHINVPEKELVDLRRRLAAKRWPDQETVTDRSQGVQLATMKELVRYWQTDYDWRKAELKLNALPEFVTTIDGVDIEFVHVRSRHPNALPLIMTHGWPGSIFELIKVIGPLTDLTAYGGRTEIHAATPQRWHQVVAAWRGVSEETPSISFCLRCQVMTSQASHRSLAGLPITSHAPGPN